MRREQLMSDEMVDFLYNGMTDETVVFNRDEWLTTERSNERSGAVEDDCEVFTRGNLDMMPDESDREHGSPLRF